MHEAWVVRTCDLVHTAKAANVYKLESSGGSSFKRPVLRLPFTADLGECDMKYREEERLLAIADTEAVASYAEHTRSLIRVAAGLSAVTQIAERVGAQAASEAARQALQKLESGTFLIAVVGEFKRGKSTFINALLGDNVLPADVLPTTAVVNRIVYGRHPACILRLNDGSSRTIAVAELRNYVTKLTPDSATAAESLTEAIVAMPTMFGQNNIQIVDTPGLGDEASMTARTMAVLPSADAAILILSARSPFSDSEMQLLRTLLNLVPADRVFIVVNQIDLLAKGADIDRVQPMLTIAPKRFRATATRLGCTWLPCRRSRRWRRRCSATTVRSFAAVSLPLSAYWKITWHAIGGSRYCSAPIRRFTRRPMPCLEHYVQSEARPSGPGRAPSKSCSRG